jgi:hypothetical protein
MNIAQRDRILERVNQVIGLQRVLCLILQKVIHTIVYCG